MIKSMLKSAFQKFGRRYNYDTTYMSQVADTSTSAGLRLSMLSLFSQYRGPENMRDVWAGALLGSTMDGDCGPCAQLVVDMAIDAGVAVEQLTLCIQGRFEKAGDVGLGFNFSQAAISGELDIEVYRSEIEDRFGLVGVVAASFAAAGGRVYPVLKRGLGHGLTCSKSEVGGELVEVQHAK